MYFDGTSKQILKEVIYKSTDQNTIFGLSFEIIFRLKLYKYLKICTSFFILMRGLELVNIIFFMLFINYLKR